MQIPESKSTNPIIHALTRKIPPKRGLPAFVWLAAIAIGIVYYRHKHPGNTGATGTIASQTADTSGSGTTAPFYGTGSSSDLGGGGGGGDSSGQNQPTQAPISWDPGQFAAMVAADVAPLITPPQDQPPTNDPVNTPDPTNTTPVTNGSPAHPSQPFNPATNPESVFQAGGPNGSHLVQPLQWGGQTFYTKADFDRWARKHGSSVKSELASHPEAAKIYKNLGANDLVAATVPSPAAMKAAGRSRANTSNAPTVTHTSAPAPVKAPTEKRTSASVKTTKAPVVKRTNKVE